MPMPEIVTHQLGIPSTARFGQFPWNTPDNYVNRSVWENRSGRETTQFAIPDFKAPTWSTPHVAPHWQTNIKDSWERVQDRVESTLQGARHQVNNFSWQSTNTLRSFSVAPSLRSRLNQAKENAINFFVPSMEPGMLLTNILPVSVLSVIGGFIATSAGVPVSFPWVVAGALGSSLAATTALGFAKNNH